MEHVGIALEHLTTGYRTGRRTAVVAEGLDARVEAGRMTCLIGRNGSGKSTLLRTMAGFLPPLAGCVTVDGESVCAMSRSRMARRVGVVLTVRPDLHGLTVAETVALGRAPYTGFWGGLGAEDHRVVAEAMMMAGVEKLAGKPMGRLSDGERQKVMVAKALAQQTPVILFDEPTAFLDYPAKASLMRLLLALAHDSGKTVFMSTHDLELAMRTADCLWLLDGGRLSVGTPGGMAADGTIRKYTGDGG